MKVKLLYSTSLALCIPLFLGKGTNNRDKGLPWVCSISNLLKAQNQICHLRFHSQITLDLRPKSMTYESRWWTTAWAPGPGPCEPIRNVPSTSGRQQCVSYCDLRVWAISLGKQQHRVARGHVFLISPRSSAHHCKTWSVPLWRSFKNVINYVKLV